jgi:hypothetical protein
MTRAGLGDRLEVSGSLDVVEVPGSLDPEDWTLFRCLTQTLHVQLSVTNHLVLLLRLSFIVSVVVQMAILTWYIRPTAR